MAEQQHAIASIDAQLGERSLSAEQRDQLLAARMSTLSDSSSSDGIAASRQQQELERELAALRDHQQQLEATLHVVRSGAAQSPTQIVPH
jgi:hypothetical protein